MLGHPGIFPGSRLLSTSLTTDAYSTLQTQVICLSECCILLDNLNLAKTSQPLPSTEGRCLPLRY